MSANPLNAVNRGVYISDNLPFLQSLNDECIDLVCIDPPFAKNETFGRKNSKAPDPLKPPLCDAEKNTEMALLRRWGIGNERDAAKAGIDWPETRYRDIWSWEKDIHEQWMKDIELIYPAVHKHIEATQEIHGEGTAAYLCYMAVRLFEIHRVLKDTGSLYLHCDHTAGAYLRQLLDAIFGKEGFRNEIAWCYKGPSNTRRWYPRKHDTILFYSKTDLWHFDQESIRVRYTRMSGTGHNSLARGRRTNEEVKRIEREYSKRGKSPEDWWSDIGAGSHIPKHELTGYPTQKPVALAERMIKASCPEGGVVLDCFAGCAYVAVAAEKLQRQWVACDINPRAWTVFKRQFSKAKLMQDRTLTCTEPRHVTEPALIGNVSTVHGPRPADLPVRTSPESEKTPPTFRIPPRKFKVMASAIPEKEMLTYLLEQSGYQAWCCGFANRMPDGTVIETTNNFHLDHLDPVSKEGSSHQIMNRAPLCPHHNIRKSNRRIHLSDLRQEIAGAGELQVDSINDLPNLTEMRQLAETKFRQADGNVPLR